MTNYEKVKDVYTSIFTDKIDALKRAGISGDIAEKKAQKSAIKDTALYFFTNNSDDDIGTVWRMIQSSHIARKCGIYIPAEKIKTVTSADQSWKSSSGHAFEEMVRDTGTRSLQSEGIVLLLQKDLSIMLKENQIKNEDTDKEWLMQQIESDTFDLYVLCEGYVYGCVQTKTSIRDRVTRDREPSMLSMSRFFWSIAFALDGGHLRNPKYIGMVNGGTPSFETNGWHAMYAYSAPRGALGGRIYQLDNSMLPFADHAVKALRDWKQRRHLLTNTWTPDQYS